MKGQTERAADEILVKSVEHNDPGGYPKVFYAIQILTLSHTIFEGKDDPFVHPVDRKWYPLHIPQNFISEAFIKYIAHQSPLPPHHPGYSTPPRFSPVVQAYPKPSPRGFWCLKCICLFCIIKYRLKKRSSLWKNSTPCSYTIMKGGQRR